MVISGPSALLALLVSLAYVGLFTAPVGRRLSQRARNGVLVALVGLAFVAHVNVLRGAPGGGLRLEPPLPHVHEIYHYFLGTRYFSELGYFGLYEATVVADAEDDASHFQPDSIIRDLERNELSLRRADVLARADEIRARFSPERWAGFKHDVGVLRAWTKPAYWHGAGFMVDHGYNGTPLVTLLLGGLSNHGLVSAEGFGGLLRWLDPYLLLLLAAVVMGLDAPVTGLAFLFFAFANPLHEYGFVGGAFLRTDYLLPLAFAVLSLRMGWLATAGALLAVSGWLRLFPLLLAGVIGLHDLLHRDALARLRGHARFYVAFGVASVAILLASSLLVASPDGRNPWIGFARNIETHAGTLAVNRIGLPNMLVRTSQPPESQRSDVAIRLRGERERESAEVYSHWRAPAAVMGGLLALLAVYAARRVALHRLVVVWMLLIYALQPLSHYYWAILALLPVMAGAEQRWHRLGGALLAVLAVTALPLIPESSSELRFALYSGEVLVFLLAATFIALRTARSGTGEPS